MDARKGPVVLVLCAAALSCGDWHSDDDGFTELDNRKLQSMVLSATPNDLGNDWAHDPAVRKFGQRLFFTKGMAKTGGVACTDCHSPREWFSDERIKRNVSVGLGITKRNSPTLVNVAFYTAFAWDGRADSIWGQSHIAFKSGATMGGTKQSAVAFVRANYASEYDAAFGADIASESVDETYVKLLKAWGAYLTTLVSRNSPFDRFASGADRFALNDAEKRGLTLFLGKAGCIQCHSGPMLSDSRFYNVGIGQTGDDVQPDNGRFDGLTELKLLDDAGYRPMPAPEVPVPAESDKNLYRTKSLRNVAKTGPYFHAGQAATLKDVVWFYNQGGDCFGQNLASFIVPLGLTDAEQADLVSFLGSLTGDEVPAEFRCDNAKDIPTMPFRFTPLADFSADGGVIGGDGGVWMPTDAGHVTVLPNDGGTFNATWYEPWPREFTRCTQ
ncbi:MAG: cytochrome c peroxidase [Archangium sp.]